MTDLERQEDQLTVYELRISELHLELESFMKELQDIEAQRKYLGDWETNRLLQKAVSTGIKTQHQINAIRQQIEFEKEGRRQLYVFEGM